MEIWVINQMSIKYYYEKQNVTQITRVLLNYQSHLNSIFYCSKDYFF